MFSNEISKIFLQEDFETLNLPNGWTLSQSSPSVGFEFGTANSLTSQYWVIPPRTNIAATNDDRYDDNSASLNIADQDRLRTPVLDFSNVTGVFMDFAGFYTAQWGGSAHIEVSTDGGSSWTSVFDLTGSTAWQNLVVDLSAYAGTSNVIIAFRFNDNGLWAGGFAVDDVHIYEPAALDVGVTRFVRPYPSCLITNESVQVEIINYGSSAVSNFNVAYDYTGTPVVETVTSTIASLDTLVYTFSATETINTPGAYNFTAWTTLSGDANTANDTAWMTLNASGSCYPRRVLLEEFTNSSSPPDANANPAYDAFIEANIDKVASVKYHMSWPGPDPFYDFNVNDNEARRNFYAINAVPNVRMDGTTDIHPGSLTQQMLDVAEAIPSFVQLNISESISGGVMNITVTADIGGVINAPTAIFIAAIENQVFFTGGNGETEFRQVMRHLLPTSAGTNISVPTTPGQTETVTASYSIDPSFNVGELRAVAWLQNLNTLEVYQAAVSSGTPAPPTVDCEIDSSITADGLFPLPDDLDCFVNGDSVAQSIQFNVPTSIDLTPFGLNGIIGTTDSITIDSIGGLPNGLIYDCHNTGCTILGGMSGCVGLGGIVNDVPGNYPLTFYTTVTVTVPIFGSQTFQATLDQIGFDYHLLVINPGAPCANDPLSVTISPADTAVCADQLVNLNSTVTGGTPPYSYSWVPSAGIADPTASTAAVIPATTTTYLLTVVDADGDSASSFSVVTVGTLPSGTSCCNINPSILDFDFYPDDSAIACIEQGVAYSQDIQIYVPVQIDLEPFGFPGTLADIVWLQIDSISNLPTGIDYSCNISGCSVSGGNHLCMGVSGTTNSTPGSYDLVIHYTGEVFHPFFGNLPVSGDLSQFDITYQLTVVAPGAPCPTQTTPLTVTMLQGDTTICAGETVQLDAMASGGEMPYAYLWQPAASLFDLRSVVQHSAD